MKIDDGVIAARYAKALFEVAASSKNEDRVRQDLTLTAPLIKKLESSLSSPAFSIEQKKALLSELMQGKVLDATLRFFQLLIEKRRFYLWPLIQTRFEKIHLEKKNKATAEVFVWRSLDASARKDLETQLARFAGKQVELNVKEDSSIIGGIVVRLGDWMMDSSLKGRLARMKESFNNGH